MKTYKAIVSEHLTKQNSQKRFVVVDKEGKVLDNNKGEGFVTEEKAIAHYELKTFGKTEHQVKKHKGKTEKRYAEKAEQKHQIDLDELEEE